MPAGTPMIARMEYHPGESGALEFMKLWASTQRGYWNLVCEYWPVSLWSRPVGLTFSNGYHSARLVHALETIPRHLQRLSSLDQSAGDGLILLQDVTAEQCDHAEQKLTECANSVTATSAASESVYADA